MGYLPRLKLIVEKEGGRHYIEYNRSPHFVILRKSQSGLLAELFLLSRPVVYRVWPRLGTSTYCLGRVKNVDFPLMLNILKMTRINVLAKLYLFP